MGIKARLDWVVVLSQVSEASVASEEDKDKDSRVRVRLITMPRMKVAGSTTRTNPTTSLVAEASSAMISRVVHLPRLPLRSRSRLPPSFPRPHHNHNPPHPPPPFLLPKTKLKIRLSKPNNQRDITHPLRYRHTTTSPSHTKTRTMVRRIRTTHTQRMRRRCIQGMDRWVSVEWV